VFGVCNEFVYNDGQTLCQQVEVVIGREDGKVMPHGNGTDQKVGI
jgi:hypothetical protein